MIGYTARDSVAHAISLTLDAECKTADKDEILDAMYTVLDLIEEQEKEIEMLSKSAGGYLEGLEEGYAAAKADQAAENERLYELLENKT